MAIKRSVKIILLISGILVLTILLAGGAGAWYLLKPNTIIRENDKPYYLYIHKGETLEEISEQLVRDNILKYPATFKTVATLTHSESLIKTGRYRINNGMSNYRLLQKLRNGLQDPLRFTFNNINYIEDFCSAAGSTFQFDSIQMLEVVRDHDFLDSLNIPPEMLLGYLLPNTYEVYWTITPRGLMLRMVQEWEKFWNEEREEKRKKGKLTRQEVLILASIIQKESNHTEELSRMAGVYINRLRAGMKLQADPTVKYANGDLSIRRVLYRHLDFPSPYNTYHVVGLPTGVICAPNPSAIDAVLNYETHDYFYFCARPGYNSMHTFARTHAQHLQNRHQYQLWLRSEGIR